MNNKTVHFINNKLHDINNKKVIITGSTSGIGLSLAHVLLEKHAHLVLAVRNIDKANRIKENLLKQHPHSNIDILIYEQDSFLGMDKLYEQIINDHKDFYALVLNAGIFNPSKKEMFIDKYPLTVGVNYLSIVYFLEKMQVFLNDSHIEKRIIVQGSLASRLHKYKNMKDLTNIKNGLMKQYNLSKYCIHNYFRYRSLSNSNPLIKYMICEPGITNTNIIRNFPKWFKKIASGFLSLFLHDSFQASLCGAYLVCNYCANGDHYVPSGFLKQTGLPKKYIDKRKIDESLVKETIKLYE